MQLPTFQGWTVDERFGEFRKADPATGLQFLPFNSPEGKPLYAAYRASLKAQQS